MILKIIPNFITILNISCGLTSIILAYHNLYLLSCVSIYIAVCFDFLDGFLAKKLNATSEFGKNLDSLADLISFALAPAFLLFVRFQDLDLHFSIYYSPFIIVIVSVIRLAKFNSTTQNNNYYNGFPTPVNALFWSGCVNATLNYNLTNKTSFQLIFISTLFIFSFLLLSKIKFFKLQFNFKSNKNKSLISYIFCIISVFLIFIFKNSALIYITLLYIFSSIFIKYY